MLTTLLFPWLNQFELDEIKVFDKTIMFGFTAQQSFGICPCCQQASNAIHSHYRRGLADLPWAGNQVVLDVCVRKFFCATPSCPRKIFCERIDSLAVPYARRTQRLYQEQQQLGLELGGEVGARTAHRQGMTVSGTTVLRQVRQRVRSVPPTPDKLGVDDWAFRKGKQGTLEYGTLLVDLERHQPIELLSDRSASSLARWLEAHPGVQVITRDRAKDYIEGASQGAPDAVQVADRFHLVQNVREMLQRLLERHQTALAATTLPEQTAAPCVEADQTISNAEEAPVCTIASVSPPPSTVATPTFTQTKAAEQRDVRRKRRLARYEQVRTLHDQGVSQRAIARNLGLSIHTVRSFVMAEQFPERATRRTVASKLDPFVPYLSQQLAAGQDNATQLWRDLCEQQGFKGSRPLVARWVAHHRPLSLSTSAVTQKVKRRGKPPQPSTEHISQRKPSLSARKAAWLLLRSPDDLDEEQAGLQQRLCHHSANIQTAYSLVQKFLRMMHTRTAEVFDDWLTRTQNTNIPELISFVNGLRADYAAVKAALSRPESNAQCEGQINRLKFIKRSMYGRANFDLLRLRVLAT
jgi:transposase